MGNEGREGSNPNADIDHDCLRNAASSGTASVIDHPVCSPSGNFISFGSLARSDAANDVAACEERCTVTVRQVLGDSTREQLVDGSFTGLWRGSEKGDIIYLKLMSNGFGLMWMERQAKTTKTAVASYWMVVPRADHTSLLCLTKEVAHASKEVATGTITVLEPDADGQANCRRISGKGANSFHQGQTIFVKTPTPHDSL